MSASRCRLALLNEDIHYTGKLSVVLCFIETPGKSLNTRPSTPVLDDQAANSRNMILRRRYDPVQFEGFDDVRLPWEYLKTRFENFGKFSITLTLYHRHLEGPLTYTYILIY